MATGCGGGSAATNGVVGPVALVLDLVDDAGADLVDDVFGRVEEGSSVGGRSAGAGTGSLAELRLPRVQPAS